MWSILWCAQCSCFCMCAAVTMGCSFHVLDSRLRMTLQRNSMAWLWVLCQLSGKVLRLFFAFLKMENYREKVQRNKNNKMKAWLLLVQGRDSSSSKDKWSKLNYQSFNKTNIVVFEKNNKTALIQGWYKQKLFERYNQMCFFKKNRY